MSSSDPRNMHIIFSSSVITMHIAHNKYSRQCGVHFNFKLSSDRDDRCCRRFVYCKTTTQLISLTVNAYMYKLRNKPVWHLGDLTDLYRLEWPNQ